VPLTNGARKHLKLRHTWARGGVTRGLGSSVHNLGAVFEAKQPGSFNLSAGLEKGGSSTRACPVVVLPAGASFKVLALRVDVRLYRKKSRSTSTIYHPRGPYLLRVGDELVVGCGQHQTPGAAPPARHPAVKVTAGRFAAGAWPFGLDLLDGAKK
jgi:hypothetical protein